MIYLDNAATSWPKPESVYRTMDAFLREKGANPGRAGHSMAVAAEKVIDQARVSLARLIGAPSDRDLVFTLNCTDALNLALKGLLFAGDHVVSDAIGHNSLVRPLHRLASEGVSVSWVQPEENITSPAALEQAITAQTKALAVTHVSNVSGLVQPLAAYAELAAKHGLVLVVDAAQSVGVIPLDVGALGRALVAFPGHKSLMGPPGTGGLYIESSIDLMHRREGGTGTFSESEAQPSGRPQRYESGTPNTVGIAGLGAGVDYLLERGVEQIRAHEMALTRAMIEGLSAIPQVTIYGDASAEQRVGVVSLNVAGWNSAEVGTVLDQAFDIKVRCGLHCAPLAHRALGTLPHGTIRASLSAFSSEHDVGAFVEAIGQVAATKPA